MKAESEEEKKKREKEQLQAAEFFQTTQGITTKFRPVALINEDTQEDQNAVEQGATAGLSHPTKLRLLETGDYYDTLKAENADEALYRVHWDKENCQAYPIPYPKLFVGKVRNEKAFKAAWREVIVLLASQGIDPVHIEFGAEEHARDHLDQVKLITEVVEELGLGVRYGKNVSAVINAKAAPMGKETRSSKQYQWFKEKEHTLEEKRLDNMHFLNIAKDRTIAEHTESVKQGRAHKDSKEELRALIDAEVDKIVDAKEEKGEKVADRDQVLKEYLLENYFRGVDEEKDEQENKTGSELLDEVLDQGVEPKKKLVASLNEELGDEVSKEKAKDSKVDDGEVEKEYLLKHYFSETKKDRAEHENKSVQELFDEAVDRKKQLKAPERIVAIKIKDQSPDQQLPIIKKATAEMEAQQKKVDAAIHEIETQLEGGKRLEGRSDKDAEKVRLIREAGAGGRQALFGVLTAEITRLQELSREYKTQFDAVKDQIKKPEKEKEKEKEKEGEEEKKDPVPELVKRQAALENSLQEAKGKLKKLQSEDQKLADKLKEKHEKLQEKKKLGQDDEEQKQLRPTRKY